MIPIAITFTDQVSITTATVVVGAILTIWVTIKTGGPWRALAEGYKEDRDRLQSEVNELHRRVGELEALPDFQSVANMIRDLSTLLAGMQETQALIIKSLNDHEKAATARWAEAQRSRSERTRSGD